MGRRRVILVNQTTIHSLNKSEDLRDAVFTRCVFKGIDFSGRDLSGAILWSSEFDDCNLTRVDFRGATFNRSRIKGCRLASANMEGVEFLGSIISISDLADVNFSRAKIDSLDSKGMVESVQRLCVSLEKELFSGDRLNFSHGDEQKYAELVNYAEGIREESRGFSSYSIVGRIRWSNMSGNVFTEAKIGDSIFSENFTKGRLATIEGAFTLEGYTRALREGSDMASWCMGSTIPQVTASEDDSTVSSSHVRIALSA